MVESDYPPLSPEDIKLMSDRSIEMYNKMRDKLIKENENGIQ